MPSATPSSSGTSAELSEVDLLMRVARRWRRQGAQEAGAGGLSPHQERALLALARLSRVRAESHDEVEHGSAEHHHHHDDGSAAHQHHEHDGSAEHHHVGVRVSHLAAHLGIAPRSATEVADALEAAGLLTRSPDPTDRRAVLLTLTERGLHTVSQVRDRRRSAADAAVATLSPADRAELRRLLQALLDT